MKKQISVFLSIFISLVILLGNASSSEYIASPLSQNAYGAYPVVNNLGHIIWSGPGGTDGGSDAEIFYWDGVNINQLTEDSYSQSYPDINDLGHAVWVGPFGSDGGTDHEVFFWNGSTIIQLTVNGEIESFPALNNNDHIVWVSGFENSQEIYYWDGSSTTRMTVDGLEDDRPDINDNNHIVWEGNHDNNNFSDSEIFYWNGTSTTQLTNNSVSESWPSINNLNHVSWTSWDGNDTEVFLWDGTSTNQLSFNDWTDYISNLNDSDRVVWYGQGTLNQTVDHEVFYYDGSSVVTLTTNDKNDTSASINNAGDIVWSGFSAGNTGTTPEIMRAILADANGDGRLDSQEVPGDVDLNGDGIFDNDQLELIKSVQANIGGSQVQVGLETGGATNIIATSSIELIDPTTIPSAPASLTSGVVSFTVNVTSPGATAEVVLFYDDPLPASNSSIYKYIEGSGWSDFTIPGNMSISPDRKKLTFFITDGGPGDGDGLANGVIVDPVGPGDPDADGDGVPDSSDICPGFDDNADEDADTVPDGCDAFPLDPTENADTDGDGLGDNSDPCVNNMPVRIVGGGDFGYTQGLQWAYDVEMQSLDTVQAQTLFESGPILLDMAKDVTIQGGFNCDFTGSPGFSNIEFLTIGGFSGSVTVENIIIGLSVLQ